MLVFVALDSVRPGPSKANPRSQTVIDVLRRVSPQRMSSVQQQIAKFNCALQYSQHSNWTHLRIDTGSQLQAATHALHPADDAFTLMLKRLWLMQQPGWTSFPAANLVAESAP